MKPLVASRRRMLSFLGTAPLAARAAADATIARLSGIAPEGVCTGGIGIPTSIDQRGAGSAEAAGRHLPYEKRLIAASDVLRLTGIPEVVDFKLRDDARYVACFDPDIASKRSWSMNVKIAAQRERNYQRGVERIRRTGAHYRGMELLRSVVGFEWPW